MKHPHKPLPKLDKGLVFKFVILWFWRNSFPEQEKRERARKKEQTLKKSLDTTMLMLS